MAGSSSPYGRLTEIVGSDLPSLHSCPFTLQVAERGPWKVVGMTCKTCLLRSTIRTKHIRIGYVDRPDVMWRSFGCYVCECFVPLLKGVRIGEARHVYSWGNPDGGNPDENACHVSPGSMCHMSSGGGVPTESNIKKLIKH